MLKQVNKSAANVLDMLTEGLAVGTARKIDNAAPAFMAAHVERIAEDRYSVAHYYVQNGDMMADPEVVFWRSGPGQWVPVQFTQHGGLAIFQQLVTFEGGQPTRYMPRAQRSCASFCGGWLRNIKRQQGGADGIRAAQGAK